MNEIAIEAINLAKKFRSGVVAVKELNLAIERGAVRPLMATGMQQRGRLRELAPLKIINDAFSAHTAPENAVT